MVKGAIEAVNKRDDIKILLTGQEALLKKALSEYTYPKDRIEIIPASEVIETGRAARSWRFGEKKILLS